MTARRQPTAFLHDVQLYLYHRAEETAAKKTREKVAGTIRDYIRAHGSTEQDDDGNEITGNIVCAFPAPVTVGGKTYTGMELRKKRNIVFDDDAAIELADRLGITRDTIGHYEYIVDQEALYVLNQQGRITDDDIDSLLAEGDPSYSLWPVGES